jgi:hypothetical protein
MNPIQQISDEVFDNWIRLILFGYYLPYFIAGNIDDWMKMGVTMNGVKPICKP